MRKVWLIAVAAAALASGGNAYAKTSAVPCKAGNLAGVFFLIDGSQGAGNVSYTLELTNVSDSACTLNGIPKIRILDKAGKALPSGLAGGKGRVTIAPWASVRSDARFTPDVPGEGEPTNKVCEPTAYWLELSAGGSSTRAAITPPTPVCDNGGLNFIYGIKAAPNYPACLQKAGTTAAMLTCIAVEHTRVDNVLNAVYRALIGTAGVDKAQLIAAENKWIAFRDADCKFAASLNAGGSLAEVNRRSCLVDQTAARAKQLQTYRRQLNPSGLKGYRTDDNAAFQTPSGKIGCNYSGAGGSTKGYLRCDIAGGIKPAPTKPKSCDLDYGNGYGMGDTGRARVLCAGDTALAPDAMKLAYGTTWRSGGFACASKRTGLRCTNRSGHGWFLSQEHSFRI